MNYIPLNIKTHYEILSSLIKIEDLVLYAKKNNVSSLGITDSNMFGSLEFINLCKKNNIKPIIGVPFLVQDVNTILYAKNYIGYKNLLNLVSIRNTRDVTNEDIIKHNGELICVISTYDKIDILSTYFNEVYLSYSDKESKMSALKLSNKVVYMKEVRYINKEDNEYLVYLNLIRDGKEIKSFNEYSYDNYLDYEISEEDVLTTKRFSDLINIELPKYEFKLPRYSVNSKELLYNLCNMGLNKRLEGKVSSNYSSRLNMELEIITNMGFTDYFLIVYDFILYSKKNNIVVGPGRGSATGSLVAYSLGITEIDPIKYNLIFERFLNKDRVTMPDIDTDIEYLNRYKVVNYLKEKYGLYKIANIITFGTLLPKQVIRDIGRIFNFNTNKIDLITKTINDEVSFSELKSNKEFMRVYNSDNEYYDLIKICNKLCGLKRHTSVHAAGVVISDEVLMNRVPLYMSGNDIVSGYSMEYLESIGLLKIDLLALKNLTIIDNIVKMVSINENVNIKLNNIPLNDVPTLDIFKNANTFGIFQFESSGMKGFLNSLKVNSFNDLILSIALYRPGPRESIPMFLSVRFNKTKASYIIPELESILSETNGIIIYQEQIMEILKRVASFSYSEADTIRRAMSKKKESVILEYKGEFIKRSVSNGIEEDKAKLIYELILKFAKYGFNKGHSVAYSVIAYRMAYLKAHFPNYFYSVLLTDEVNNPVKTNEYINEGKILGVCFRYPSVNLSTKEYIVYNGDVILPLTIIKGINKDVVDAIISERSNGLFKSYLDFVKRLFDKVSPNDIKTLVLANVLREFGINKKTMIENLSNLIEYSKLASTLDEELISVPELIMYEEYSKEELINYTYMCYMFYLDNHPTTKFKRVLTIKDIPKYFDKFVNLVLLIENIRVVDTKKKEKMAFMSVSDDTGKISAILFPNQYKLYSNLKRGSVIRLYGKVEKRVSEYQLIANKIEIL